MNNNNSNNWFSFDFTIFQKMIFNNISKYFIYNSKPNNPAGKYLEFQKNKTQFNKLPMLYTNPKWNPQLKKLEFNSFDYELELAKKRPQVKNFNYYPFHYNFNPFIKTNKNDKKFPLIFTNPKWNPKLKKLEFNSLDYELKKAGYYK
jgi:hypothetical protein